MTLITGGEAYSLLKRAYEAPDLGADERLQCTMAGATTLVEITLAVIANGDAKAAKAGARHLCRDMIRIMDARCEAIREQLGRQP